DGLVGDLAQRHHRVLVVVALQGDLRPGGDIARTLGREQHQLEAVGDLEDAIFDGYASHADTSPEPRASPTNIWVLRPHCNMAAIVEQTRLTIRLGAWLPRVTRRGARPAAPAAARRSARRRRARGLGGASPAPRRAAAAGRRRARAAADAAAPRRRAAPARHSRAGRDRAPWARCAGGARARSAARRGAAAPAALPARALSSPRRRH